MKTLVLHIIFTLAGSYLFFVNSDWPATALHGIVMLVGLFLLLWVLSFIVNRNYFYKLPKAFGLLLYFFKEFIVANLRIAQDILSRKYYMHPTLVALPLDVRSDFEITMLASVITLTPGTLSIDLSPDRKFLYLHALYIPKGGIEALKQDIKTGFEKRIIELMA